MKRIKTLILFSLFALLWACNTKAPIDSENSDDAKPTMAQAKENLDNATVKAAQLREEAAKLRMSGSSDDEAKAIKLEQDAARLESDALNQLNPSFH